MNGFDFKVGLPFFTNFHPNFLDHIYHRITTALWFTSAYQPVRTGVSSRFTTFASLAVLTAKFYHASVLSRINPHYSLNDYRGEEMPSEGNGWSNAYVRG